MHYKTLNPNEIRLVFIRHPFPEVETALSEHERALMGFKTWQTYGTSDEFGAEWARPGKDNMGEMSLVTRLANFASFIPDTLAGIRAGTIS